MIFCRAVSSDKGRFSSSEDFSGVLGFETTSFFTIADFYVSILDFEIIEFLATEYFFGIFRSGPSGFGT